MAKHFDKLTDFNEYLQLPKPTRTGIDIGEYGLEEMRLSSEPITTSFYRISMKYNFKEADTPEYVLSDGTKPRAVMFFSSPSHFIEWHAQAQWQGFYIHLSREVIAKNKHLFFSFMEYGKHEGLYLDDRNEKQLASLFRQLNEVHHNTDFPNDLW